VDKHSPLEALKGASANCPCTGTVEPGEGLTIADQGFPMVEVRRRRRPIFPHFSHQQSLFVNRQSMPALSAVSGPAFVGAAFVDLALTPRCVIGC
jgi:hypothetical protein